MKKIVIYVQEANPLKRIRQIKKPGWINDREYVCPSFQVTRPDNNGEYELSETAQNWGYGINGTLKEWQDNVAKYCVGNNIPMFSLCAGVAGPLLNVFPNIGTTVINLTGITSRGKTTALLVAASLWGESSKYRKQWRSTDNALESVFEAYNDGLCILDDLGQVDAKKVGEIAYMAGNERGKGRCKFDATRKKEKEWRGQF
jgi:putative DNA primase/helicase